MTESYTLAPPYFSAAAPQHRGAERVFDWPRMLETTSEAPAWSLAEAFFAVLLSAAVCDGAVQPIEQETLLALVHRSRALKALSKDDLAALNVSVVEKLRSASEDGLARACAALPADLRLPIFAHALDIVLADGELTNAEAALLNALAAHMSLAPADVERIAEIIILKNRA